MTTRAFRHALVLALCMGCVGRIDDGFEDQLPSGRGDPPTAGPQPGAQPGTMPLRRLTQLELANTIEALLGSRPRIPDGFPPDAAAESGFTTGGSVSRVEADMLMSWAGSLALEAVGHLDKLVSCKGVPATRAQQDACARSFVVAFGRRAFRRPLAPPEIDELVDYYQRKLRGPEVGYDFTAAIRGLVQLVLQSPRFLYRWELGPRAPSVDGQGRVRLDAHEMASRLSYFLWASMPDDQLFAAADLDQLGTPPEIEAQARRMLSDPRSRPAIESFHLLWLGIGDVSRAQKDPGVYEFSPELGQAMLAETRRFVTWAFEQGGRLDTLLESPVAFLDGASLAAVYGYRGFQGTAPRQIMLNQHQRAGLLTRASFLTTQAKPYEANPTKRGKIIAERILCRTLSAPPANVPPLPTDIRLPLRERATQHAANECARACHGVIDPLGFALGHYDGVGAFQDMDAGKPIDASGTVALASGESKRFEDAIDLSSILAAAPEVGDCLAKQWLRFALGRLEVPGDGPSLRAAVEAFHAHSDDLRELAVAIATSPAFAYRSLSAGETP